MRLDDPELVRNEYASEEGLRARRSIYDGAALTEPVEVALAEVAAIRPCRVLEVGCGWGEFAARIRDDLGAEIVATDLSPRMVELARGRGLDAGVADVRSLPFADGAFDCIVANWMLYHVDQLDRALGELARVLRRGGRLVATTTAYDHLAELWALVGRDRSSEPARFFAETGELELRKHFTHVRHRVLRHELVLADAVAARDYVAASVAHKHLAQQLPTFEGSLAVTSVGQTRPGSDLTVMIRL